MRELRSRQNLKRRLYSTPALLGLFILCSLLTRGAYAVLIKERESATNLDALKVKVATLSESKVDLEEKIRRLNTGEGIDEAIKEKFNVATAGEHVAVIIPPVNPATTTASTTESWYERFWDAIIH